MVKNKKAYMKTLEVVIALVLTFAFILYILPTPQLSMHKETKDILINLIGDDEFRCGAMNITGCEYKGDNTTLSNILDDSLSNYQNYAICMQGTLPSLPRTKVNAESLYLTGNISEQNPKVIRLYYWE